MSVNVRPIDHVVLAARDLAALRATYVRLGFTVGPENRHPWGTHNHIVQFDGTFLELIALPNDVVPAAAGGTFGGFIRDYLDENAAGFATLALRAQDACADAEAFRQAGIGDGVPFRFERMAQRPNGQAAKVGFTLAFAASRLMPRLGFFTCQQHAPENFWSPGLQTHPNGALGVKGVVVVARDPADHAEFLSAFTGRREMLATSMGIELELAAGQHLDVLTPAAARFRFGDGLPPASDEARFCVVRVSVGDLGVTRDVLTAAGVAFDARDESLVVPADPAAGCAVSFEQA